MAHVKAKLDTTPAWLAYWRSRPMPILEASKTSLQQMLRRADRVQADAVAEVVLSDPLLTLQALRCMAQRPRSSLAAEVVSIQSIVMMMGTVPFLERFCNLPTVESILLPDSSAYSAYLQQVFYSRLSVRLALMYADWRFDARLDEIQVAATLSRCNHLLLLLGTQLDKALPPKPDECAGFLSGLSAPASVVQLLGSADNAPVRVLLQLAVLRLVAAIPRGWWQEETQQELGMIAGMLNMEVTDVWLGLCKVLLHFARDPNRWPQMDQPACLLPMIPGDWPGDVISKPQVERPIEAGPDMLATHMQALHLSSKNGAQAKDILALTMRALAEGLHMQRVIFALATPGLAELRARFVLGMPQNAPLRQLSIRTDLPGILTRLLEKPQSLWLNRSNAGQYMPHFPTDFRQCFVSDNFFVMSIFIGSKPLGLILADRNGAETLSEHQYQHFKQICLLTTRALSQSTNR